MLSAISSLKKSYQSNKLISVLFVYAIIAAAFACIAYNLGNWQKGLFLTLNHWLVNATGEQFWYVITNFGDGFFLFPIAMIIFLNDQIRQKILIVSLFTSCIIINCTKYAIAFGRPGTYFDGSEFNVIGNLLYSFNSLPSGHTATAFLLVGLAYSLNKKSLFYTLFGLASLVGLSRIAVGAHWPLDILFGMITGLFCAYAAILISQKLTNNNFWSIIYLSLSTLTCYKLLSSALSDHHLHNSLWMTELTLGAICATLAFLQLHSLLINSNMLNSVYFSKKSLKK